MTLLADQLIEAITDFESFNPEKFFQELFKKLNWRVKKQAADKYSFVFRDAEGDQVSAELRLAKYSPKNYRIVLDTELGAEETRDFNPANYNINSLVKELKSMMNSYQ